MITVTMYQRDGGSVVVSGPNAAEVLKQARHIWDHLAGKGNDAYWLSARP